MRSILTMGLGYGDEGKGTIVDALARHLKSSLVVRYNGGCQAAHNVINSAGVHHTFSQIGAGAFSGADTFLSHRFLLAPDNFVQEYQHLQVAGGINTKVYVDFRAPIVTPFHRIANRIRERDRGDKLRHGSCGQGIHETMKDIEAGDCLRVEHILYGGRFRDRLRKIAQRKLEEVNHLRGSPADLSFLRNPPIDFIEKNYDLFLDKVSIASEGWLRRNLSPNTIFEGAQGFYLDPRYGHFPHVTHNNTTLEWAEELLDDADPEGERFRLGITRSYATRHGRGPLPTENGQRPEEFDRYNSYNQWQEDFRIGDFDMEATRFAMKTCNIEALAVTCLDQSTLPWKFFDGEQLVEVESVEDCIERRLGPIAVESFGPYSEQKQILLPFEGEKPWKTLTPHSPI